MLLAELEALWSDMTTHNNTPRYIQNPDGTMNGSVGEGRDAVPTAPAVTPTPASTDPEPAVPLAHVRAVLEPRLPSTLSPSSVNTFRKCPKLFYFTKVLRHREPGSAATVKGTLTHKVLEELWALEPVERTPTVAAALADAHWARMLTNPDVRATLDGDPNHDSDDHLLTHAKALLDAYFDLEDTTAPGVVDIPFFGQVNGQELHVQATVGDGTFQGYIDRLDLVRDDATGEYVFRVVDYKTGKLPARPQYLDDYWFQQMTYASLLRAKYGISVGVIRLVFLQGQVYEKTLTDVDIDMHDEALVEAYEEVQHAASTDHWPGKPAFLCNWCYFREQCADFQNSKFPKR